VIASGDSAEVKARREVWLTVFEQLRRVERVNSEVERLKKGSFLISEVELSKLHVKIRTMLDALPDRHTHRLWAWKLPLFGQSSAKKLMTYAASLCLGRGFSMTDRGEETLSNVILRFYQLKEKEGM
jgi:hypothetical protein